MSDDFRNAGGRLRTPTWPEFVDDMRFPCIMPGDELDRVVALALVGACRRIADLESRLAKLEARLPCPKCNGTKIGIAALGTRCDACA